MKAIRIHAFGDPDVMQLEDAPNPAAGEGQVLIDVRAIGVNPVDTYIRAGKYGPRAFPHTLGFDLAGVVEKVGQGVTRFKPGQRVYASRPTTGAYAQKAVADKHSVYPLPEKITFAQGAALGVPYGTAYCALHIRGAALPGEIVLIHGATGSVGLAAVQMARAPGCTVIGTGGSAAGRDLVLKEGAHHAFDHHEPDYLMKLMDLTGGTGVNLILEMVSNVNLGHDLTVLAKRGRVVVIGSRGRVEIDPRDTMSRESDIRGMSLMSASTEELTRIHAGIGAGLENGTLRPIIDHEMPLAQAPEAHVEVLQGDSHGKIVLVP